MILLALARIAQSHRNSASDPNFGNVSALLHFDGANGSTTFVDQKSNTWTPVSPAQLDTSTFEFSPSSMKLDGTTAKISCAASAAFGMGTGDYTIECFAKSNNTSSHIGSIVDLRTAGNTGVHFWMGGGVSAQPANVIGFSSNTAVIANGGTVSAGTWFHLALCRASGTVRGFVNGVQAFSASDTRTYASSTTCIIGGDYAGTSTQYFGGWIDELRITKGVARYTSNFTAPSVPFPNH